MLKFISTRSDHKKSLTFHTTPKTNRYHNRLSETKTIVQHSFALPNLKKELLELLKSYSVSFAIMFIFLSQ